MPMIHCASCGVKLDVAERKMGTPITCPACKGPVFATVAVSHSRAPDPGKAKRRFIFGAVIGVLVLGVVAIWAAPRNPLLSSPHGKAVHEYLQRTLNNPEYSVMDWDVDKSLGQYREAYLDNLKIALNSAKEDQAKSEQSLNVLKQNPAALELDFGYRKQAKDLNEKLAALGQLIPDVEREIEHYTTHTRASSKLCELKYRAHGGDGGLRIYRGLFLVGEHGVREYDWATPLGQPEWRKVETPPFIVDADFQLPAK
ncbi:MAG: hypothetical protein HY290_03465 [Planctomycetia bacterium]|nr:hypothetical protein [Planctomycetia bacterium]